MEYSRESEKSYTMTQYNDINIQILLPLTGLFNMIVN